LLAAAVGPGATEPSASATSELSTEPAREARNVRAHLPGLEPGASIGRYTILGLVGRGGMGEVYAAYDSSLDRKVALKVMLAEISAQDSRAQERLLREAQAIAKLSHPSVVVVYEVGTFGDSVFIAMEFIEGETLSAWCAAKSRTPREVLDVLLAAGRGLAAAHEAGLVHRDFKPENVMITKSGQVRVTDFGLAREIADAKDPDDPAVLEPALSPSSAAYLRMNLTRTGAFMGTPRYASPEQALGSRTDARSDQFSYCVTLYEALYGERPFDGRSLMALTDHVLEQRIRPAPPGTRVPAWLRRTVLKGLKANPRERYRSMAELFEALGRDPAVVRRRWVVGAGAALLAATVLIGAMRLRTDKRAACAGGPSHSGAVWSPAARAEVRRAFVATGAGGERAFAAASEIVDRYVARWNGMFQEACEATQLRAEQSADVLDLRMECLDERLQSLRALVDVFRTANATVAGGAASAASSVPTIERCADVTMLRAVVRPPEDAVTRARVSELRQRVARVSALAMAGECGRALELSKETTRDATTLGYLPLEAEALFAPTWGSQCLDPWRQDAAAKEAFVVAEASRHDDIAIRATAGITGSTPDEKQYWLRVSRAILSRFPGRHPDLEGWTATSAGTVSLYEGRMTDALREYQRAMDIATATFGDRNFNTVFAKMNVAMALHAAGRDAEAEPLIRGCIAVLAGLGAGDSIHMAVALSTLTDTLTGLGRFGDARVANQHAFAIVEKANGPSGLAGGAWLALGELELAQGRHEEARRALRSSIVALSELPSQSWDEKSTYAEAEFALARALWESRADQGEAVAHARTARAALESASASRLLPAVDDWLTSHGGAVGSKGLSTRLATTRSFYGAGSVEKNFHKPARR
jgi:tRNA A-37 threonylcarbamoyl transferase component Bud32/tetratricopeptide (TPR) repeat protein